MVKAPAAEVILKIHQFFGQLIKLPMGTGVLVDLLPEILNGRIRLPAALSRRTCQRGDADAVTGDVDGDLIEARLCQLRTQGRMGFCPMRVHFHQRPDAVAQEVFHQPVLMRLKTRRIAKGRAKRGVFAGGHCAQHIPGRVQLLKDPGHPGKHLERRLQLPCPHHLSRRLKLMNGQPHPQL